MKEKSRDRGAERCTAYGAVVKRIVSVSCNNVVRLVTLRRVVCVCVYVCGCAGSNKIL